MTFAQVHYGTLAQATLPASVGCSPKNGGMRMAPTDATTAPSRTASPQPSVNDAPPIPSGCIAEHWPRRAPLTEGFSAEPPKGIVVVALNDAHAPRSREADSGARCTLRGGESRRDEAVAVHEVRIKSAGRRLSARIRERDRLRASRYTAPAKVRATGICTSTCTTCCRLPASAS